ncbi:MAG: hypothetical protein LBM04_05040 [Opitutaceae bacterium]|nr:hypothetical protein [Opitutaceae bacterium]
MPARRRDAVKFQISKIQTPTPKFQFPIPNSKEIPNPKSHTPISTIPSNGKNPAPYGANVNPLIASANISIAMDSGSGVVPPIAHRMPSARGSSYKVACMAASSTTRNADTDSIKTNANQPIGRICSPADTEKNGTEITKTIAFASTATASADIPYGRERIAANRTDSRAYRKTKPAIPKNNTKGPKNQPPGISSNIDGQIMGANALHPASVTTHAMVLAIILTNLEARIKTRLLKYNTSPQSRA